MGKQKIKIMKIKKYLLLTSTLCVGFVFAFVITGCSRDEFVLEQVGSEAHVEIMGVDVKLKNQTLALSSESELQDLISTLKAYQSVSTRQSSEEILNNEVRIDGFKSLYDIFEEAMRDAESYYDREGGYEEFKEKFTLFSVLLIIKRRI